MILFNIIIYISYWIYIKCFSYIMMINHLLLCWIMSIRLFIFITTFNIIYLRRDIHFHQFIITIFIQSIWYTK